MKAPIVFLEHGDVMLFPDADHASRYIEPLDVINQEYEAYDAVGTPLKLVTNGLTNPVTILVDASKDQASEKVRSAIVNFLTHSGVSGDEASTAPLSTLLDMFIARFGFTK
jgi:hypothetical protein